MGFGKIIRVVSIATCAVLEVQASRQAIPVNLVSGTAGGKPLRVLQQPGQCMWVAEVSKQFCCDSNLTRGDCEIEYDWFMEDNKETIANAERKKEARELNDAAGTVIQWITIVICAICCPLLIIMSIVMCISKRREAAARAQITNIRGRDFQEGVNMADSSEDEFEFVENRRPPIQTQPIDISKNQPANNLKRQHLNVSDKLRDVSESEQASGSYASESDSNSQISDNEQGGSLGKQTKKAGIESSKYSTTETQAPKSALGENHNGADSSPYLASNISAKSTDNHKKNPPNSKARDSAFMKAKKSFVKTKILTRASYNMKHRTQEPMVPPSHKSSKNASEFDRDEDQIRELRDFLDNEDRNDGRRNGGLEVAKSALTPKLDKSSGIRRQSNRKSKRNLSSSSDGGLDIL